MARSKFHGTLVSSCVLAVPDSGVPTNADANNRASVAIASSIAQQIGVCAGHRPPGQTAGNLFEAAVTDYLRDSFLSLDHLRPGSWRIEHVRSRDSNFIARFAQYEHLRALQAAAQASRDLAAALGNDYTISPDVVVIREVEPDARINKAQTSIVDDSVARRADLRQDHDPSGASKQPLLHASISTKWTLRSDRAQNARSEALNLIRNRKGRQPHIVVVTAEPTPSRLASLALGTGDIDCVYHFALDELMVAVAGLQQSEAESLLAIMVEGKRLKDISDLPLDLAV